MMNNNEDSNFNSELAPFSCQYTPQVPELLQKLNCTIAISTYQAGKLIFISAKDENSLVQLPRHFDKVMGIAEHSTKDKLALACKDEVIVFSNSIELALHYPKAPGKYDSLYMPKATYHTGQLDLHDLSFGKNEDIYAVNTLFSCITKINSDFNFSTFWKPNFIDQIVSEDRCHLNGMAMQNGIPKYATAFNQGNSQQSWRENVTKTGVIIDIETNRVIARNLPMPHSPRIFNGELYVLLSATGELVKVNTNTGTYQVIIKLDGFVRGMSLHKNYLFIGLSKLRKNSSTFAELDFADKANNAGITIIHLPTASISGKISYLSSLDEIYDVHILPNKIRPNILNTLNSNYKKGITTENTTFWMKNIEP
tara:strand:+ start:2940 stop:4040 length:1101 start_codon:yes stop_codon:yes gene_type:complete